MLNEVRVLGLIFYLDSKAKITWKWKAGFVASVCSNT